MDAQKIGERLENLRGEKSLAIVAEDTGISISALSMYESGNRIPRDDVKVSLANYYGKTVQEIFFKEQLHEVCN